MSEPTWHFRNAACPLAGRDRRGTWERRGGIPGPGSPIFGNFLSGASEAPKWPSAIGNLNRKRPAPKLGFGPGGGGEAGPGRSRRDTLETRLFPWAVVTDVALGKGEEGCGPGIPHFRFFSLRRLRGPKVAICNGES